MLGLFIILFCAVIAFVGWTGGGLIITGAAGAIFVFLIVCFESMTLVQWFQEKDC